MLGLPMQWHICPRAATARPPAIVRTCFPSAQDKPEGFIEPGQEQGGSRGSCCDSTGRGYYDSQTGSARRRRANCRHGARGPSLMTGLWDRSRDWMDIHRTNRDTITRHCRTCRRSPVYSETSAPRDESCHYPNLHHTTRHCRAHCFRCRGSFCYDCRRDRRIPTGLP